MKFSDMRYATILALLVGTAGVDRAEACPGRDLARIHPSAENGHEKVIAEDGGLEGMAPTDLHASRVGEHLEFRSGKSGRDAARPAGDADADDRLRAEFDVANHPSPTANPARRLDVERRGSAAEGSAHSGVVAKTGEDEGHHADERSDGRQERGERDRSPVRHDGVGCATRGGFDEELVATSLILLIGSLIAVVCAVRILRGRPGRSLRQDALRLCACGLLCGPLGITGVELAAYDHGQCPQ